MRTKRCQAGYSLYELIITLAVVAVTLTVGIPSFGGIVADHRLRVESTALFHAFHQARKESIVRRRVVTLCPSIDGQSCTGTTDWSSGWIMFVNNGMQNTHRRDPGEALIRHQQVAKDARIQANRRTFSLRSTELRATNGTLILCDRSDRADSRALVVSYTGRPRVTRETRTGKRYQCAD